MPDTDNSAPRIQTFQEFWPYYLGEHRLARTKWIHFFGTTLALLTLIAGLITHIWWLFILMFVAGYAPAWYAHFFEEHNRPATFKYPFWSLIADFKLWFLMLIGKIR